MLTVHELAYQVSELRPRLFIAEGYTALEQLLDADDGDAIEATGDEWGPLMVRFSSGTTGKPKAMVSSQRAQLENYRLVMAMLDMRPGDIHLVTGPLGHAALHAGLKQRLAERFPHLGLVEAYGSLEFGYVSALMPDEQSHAPRSVGRPLPGQDVAIFDDSGRPCPNGEIGMIHVRSPELVTRHVGSIRPEPTRAEQRNEGWLTSGDLGYFDDERFLYISELQNA